MEIKVNGEAKSVSEGALTVAGLLKLCNVEMPEMVSVQLNGAFVDRNDFSSTFVKADGEVDFLYFMGGGR